MRLTEYIFFFNLYLRPLKTKYDMWPSSFQFSHPPLQKTKKPLSFVLLVWDVTEKDVIWLFITWVFYIVD